MAITPLPAAPNPATDTPAAYSTKAAAFAAALPTFGTEANAQAAALTLNAVIDTSSTSNTIGVGALTFTVTAGKSFQPGMWLTIADTAAPSTNNMNVQVTSYTGTTLIVNSVSVMGSGTKTAWTISQSGPGYPVTAKNTMWIPALALVPRITNGPGSGSTETATNKVNTRTLNFDPTTAEFAQFGIQMPKSWNEGTVTFKAVWSHAATTVNFGVAWSLAGAAISDNEALEIAFGTKQTVTDTGGVTDNLYIAAESAAITIAGSPAPQDYVVFQLDRTVADAADLMAIDARLHGIQLYYTVDTATDA